MIIGNHSYRKIVPALQKYYKTYNLNTLAIHAVILSVEKFFSVKIQYQVFDIRGGAVDDVYFNDSTDRAIATMGRGDGCDDVQMQTETPQSTVNAATEGVSSGERENEGESVDDETQGTNIEQELAEPQVDEDEQAMKKSEPLEDDQNSKMQHFDEVRKLPKLLSKFYFKQSDLLNGLHALQRDYKPEAILVHSTVTGGINEEEYRYTLNQLIKNYNIADNELLYASINKALICMVYYIEWRTLQFNHQTLYWVLRLDFNGRMRIRKHKEMLRTGKNINDLCYRYGMSSLCLFSVVSANQIGRSSKADFERFLDPANPILQLTGHKPVNAYLEGFKKILLESE